MPADSRPNILVVLTDQQRHDTISAHVNNFGVRTPAMDSLVHRGVTFSNAFCNNPICSPSRASLQTGLYPSRCGVPCNASPPLSESLPTTARRMQAVGYQTVYHGKSHLKGDLKNYGFEIAYENSHDPSTLTEASRFWRNRDWTIHSRPFYQAVSFLDPHDIYFLDPELEDAPSPSPWGNLDASDADRPIMRGYVSPRPNWSLGRWAYYRRFYKERVERVDAFIGELLAELTCSGFASNTWIIFSSDHADFGGEHGHPFKGLSLYDASMHVPLIIAPPETRRLGKNNIQDQERPRAPEPFVSDALASHIDIAPTILDLAGVAPDPTLPGRSLLPAIQRKPLADPEGVFFESTTNGKATPALRAIRTREWKYILASGGEEEMYHLAKDPWETRNLAGAVDAAATKIALRDKLMQHLTRERDPFALNRA